MCLTPLLQAKDVEVADTLQGAAMVGNIQAKFRPMLERVKQALAEAEGVRLGSTERSSVTAYSGRMSELSSSGMTGTPYGEISRSSVAGETWAPSNCREKDVSLFKRASLQIIECNFYNSEGDCMNLQSNCSPVS